MRVLGEREDAARALVVALDGAQRTAAIIDDVAPDDILTGVELDIDPLSPVGVKAAALNPSQRDLLMRVIDAYTSIMADDVAAERMAKIREAGHDDIGFVWAGPTDRGEPHYYRVQGPTFLIEYDNMQGGGNHVHSVWRDFARRLRPRPAPRAPAGVSPLRGGSRWRVITAVDKERRETRLG